MNHISWRDGASHSHHPQVAASGRRVSRRQFLKYTAGLGAGVALTRMLPTPVHAAKRNKDLPKPQKSGIEHVVVVMMENRSYDHLLGWYPNGDGKQSGLVYQDKNNVDHPTLPLTDWNDTVTGRQPRFQARSVVGGLNITFLDNPALQKQYTSRAK